jgi:putative ABC transport system permease protein
MREQNVLKKCCLRSLKENRKRTAVTIVGIILATALITGVACILVSFRASMILYEKQQNGDFHYHFVEVGREYLKYFENNINIEKCSLAENLGYAPLEGSQNPDKPYIFVSAIEKGMEDTLALKLTEGRFPENDSELAVGGHVCSNGLADIRVGDVLELQIGERMADDYVLGQDSPYVPEEERFVPTSRREYTVVGILERPSQEWEPRIAPGYSAVTLLEDPESAEEVDVYVSYTKKGLRNADQVNAGILGVDVELYRRYYVGEYLGTITPEEQQQIQTVAKNVQENYWLLKWELLIFTSNIMNMLYAMSAIAILIIIVTSVFCIHNSFMISLTEKMKLYGRLASVGTTRRQQKKIVYYEAAVLGLAGVPLGVLCGIAATAVLVGVVGGLVEDALGFRLIFGVSVRAILAGVALSAATVYLSASGSARRAARVSPISAIRSNDTVREGKNMSGKALRCPALIDRFFGIGGKIAYRNLRRARVKYRTTVISIVVSVAAFIGLSTFVELLMYSSAYYYKDFPYQIRVSINKWDSYDKALQIAGMAGVQEAEVVRSVRFFTDQEEIAYSGDYLEQGYEYAEIILRSLGEEAYARYCRNVGVSAEEARGKAIVLADYFWEYFEDGKLYKGEGDIAAFRPGQVLKGTGIAEGLEIEVLTQTRVRPIYQQRSATGRIELIVSEEWMDRHLPQGSKYDEMKYDNVDVYVKCENADEIEAAVRKDIQLQHYTLTNFDAQYRSDRSLHLVVAIFLYGFITVVALIGITNIFNTITTNMELRSPEFAMLRSVGMTGYEFRRLIVLESVFYGGKALLIGIPLGFVLSLCFNRALGEGMVTSLRLPWKATAVAAAAVGLLLYAIMQYSMGKVRQKDIIETIRNENI